MQQVSTQLVFNDWLGAFGVRLGIGRGKYRVKPGIYSVGNPDQGSTVFVTANYKLSFDTLRKELTGIDCYILVLDTLGINVWCAAGKGTFGTKELVRQVRESGLKDIVTHRNLIVPQLGATGVAAHVVKLLSGFKVIYGPVRAKDIKEFMEAGMKATAEMRRVRFDLTDRLAQTPLHMIQTFPIVLVLAIVMMFIAGFGQHPWSMEYVIDKLPALPVLALAWLGGSLFTPMLLPYIPGAAFSVKGVIVGLVLWVLTCVILRYVHWGFYGYMDGPFLFLLPAISSYFAMNFTGDSTYTSLSGVKKEMRYAIPAQIGSVVFGLAIWTLLQYIT